MKEIAITIVPGAYVPLPVGPRPVSEHVHIDCMSLEATEWVWDGTNVALVKVTGTTTVREQIDALKDLWHRTGMRPLRADEFVQLFEHANEWVQEWKDLAVGSRIYFPGTEYNLIYADETFQRVFAARYDHEVQDWIAECEDTSALFNPGDRVACIMDAIPKRDDPCVTWSHSFDRRRLFVAYDRPPSIRNRYYPGIEVRR